MPMTISTLKKVALVGAALAVLSAPALAQSAATPPADDETAAAAPAPDDGAPARPDRGPGSRDCDGTGPHGPGMGQGMGPGMMGGMGRGGMGPGCPGAPGSHGMGPGMMGAGMMGGPGMMGPGMGGLGLPPTKGAVLVFDRGGPGGRIIIKCADSDSTEACVKAVAPLIDKGLAALPQRGPKGGPAPAQQP